MIAAIASLSSSGFVAPVVPRASKLQLSNVAMQADPEATRDSEPDIRFGEGSGWCATRGRWPAVVRLAKCPPAGMAGNPRRRRRRA